MSFLFPPLFQPFFMRVLVVKKRFDALENWFIILGRKRNGWEASLYMVV